MSVDLSSGKSIKNFDILHQYSKPKGVWGGAVKKRDARGRAELHSCVDKTISNVK